MPQESLAIITGHQMAPPNRPLRICYSKNSFSHKEKKWDYDCKKHDWHEDFNLLLPLVVIVLSTAQTTQHGITHSQK